MPTTIIKLSKDDKDYFMFWSTVTDSPQTFGYSYSEFLELFRGTEEDGKGLVTLKKRLERANKTGSSNLSLSKMDIQIAANRAGKNEKHLTKDEIIEWYCEKKSEPPENIGIAFFKYEKK